MGLNQGGIGSSAEWNKETGRFHARFSSETRDWCSSEWNKKIEAFSCQVNLGNTRRVLTEWNGRQILG